MLVAKPDSLASTCEENTGSPQLCISLCLRISGVHPVCVDSGSPGELSLQGWCDNSVPSWEEHLPPFFFSDRSSHDVNWDRPSDSP